MEVPCDSISSEKLLQDEEYDVENPASSSFPDAKNSREKKKKKKKKKNSNNLEPIESAESANNLALSSLTGSTLSASTRKVGSASTPPHLSSIFHCSPYDFAALCEEFSTVCKLHEALQKTINAIDKFMSMRTIWFADIHFFRYFNMTALSFLVEDKLKGYLKPPSMLKYTGRDSLWTVLSYDKTKCDDDPILLNHIEPPWPSEKSGMRQQEEGFCGETENYADSMSFVPHKSKVGNHQQRQEVFRSFVIQLAERLDLCYKEDDGEVEKYGGDGDDDGEVEKSEEGAGDDDGDDDEDDEKYKKHEKLDDKVAEKYKVAEKREDKKDRVEFEGNSNSYREVRPKFREFVQLRSTPGERLSSCTLPSESMELQGEKMEFGGKTMEMKQTKGENLGMAKPESFEVDTMLNFEVSRRDLSLLYPTYECVQASKPFVLDDYARRKASREKNELVAGQVIVSHRNDEASVNAQSCKSPLNPSKTLSLSQKDGIPCSSHSFFSFEDLHENLWFRKDHQVSPFMWRIPPYLGVGKRCFTNRTSPPDSLLSLASVPYEFEAFMNRLLKSIEGSLTKISDAPLWELAETFLGLAEDSEILYYSISNTIDFYLNADIKEEGLDFFSKVKHDEDFLQDETKSPVEELEKGLKASFPGYLGLSNWFSREASPYSRIKSALYGKEKKNATYEIMLLELQHIFKRSKTSYNSLTGIQWFLESLDYLFFNYDNFLLDEDEKEAFRPENF